MRPAHFQALATGLLFLTSSAVRADAPPGATWPADFYRLRAIVKQGDTVDGIKIARNADFEIGGLNDRGQLVFTTENQAGGEALIYHWGGEFTTIAAAGRASPTGTWPSMLGILSPVSMSQSGQVLFLAAHFTSTGPVFNGVYLWDAAARKTTTVLRKGMPLGQDLTLADMQRPPAMNNSADIAFTAVAKDASGKKQQGVFFLGRDGQLLPVALAGQDLPGGGKLGQASVASINDAGMVGIEATAQGSNASGAYVWEKGTLTPLVTVGSREPGGKLFVNAVSPQMNNKNRNVFLAARIGDRLTANDYQSPLTGIYQVADGQCRAVAVVGQEMPGGGKIRSFPGQPVEAVPGGLPPWLSPASYAGGIAFTAKLDDGTTGAYWVTADGKPLLVLKEKTATTLGTITTIAVATSAPPSNAIGIGLNGWESIALPVRIDNGPQTIVLLDIPGTRATF